LELPDGQERRLALAGKADSKPNGAAIPLTPPIDSA
jgi:hypothetical protein